jgi:hypothetical protein
MQGNNRRRSGTILQVLRRCGFGGCLTGVARLPWHTVPTCQVEGSVEQECSQVVATDRLLREAMAMVGQDVLHPIWVS